MGDKGHLHKHRGDHAGRFLEIEPVAGRERITDDDESLETTGELAVDSTTDSDYELTRGSSSFGSSSMGGYAPGMMPHTHHYHHHQPKGYPPINIPPVKPMPADPYSGQFPLSVALHKGTLFKWLYDPYKDPYR